jgi:hypothetical protein
MEEFIAKYPDAGAGAGARKMALEAVENNIRWAEKHLKFLVSWFENNADSSASGNDASSPECPHQETRDET